MRPIVAIDVDDVVAQFRRRFVDVANSILGTSYTLEECSELYECEKAMKLTKTQNSKVWVEINKEGFASSLDLMPGAGDAIERIASKCEVVFVTSPLKSSKTWVSDRRKWIVAHFGRHLGDHIITTRAKHMVDADIFIDDRVDMIEAWLKKRIERSRTGIFVPIFYAWPYNAEYAKSAMIDRCHTWPQILERLCL